MKKMLLTLILVFALTSLTGCEKDDFDPSLEPPLSERELKMAVPDFLTEEQQLLYRKAYSLYQHMFGGETSAIEYTEFMNSNEISSFKYEAIQIGSYSYKKSLGRYKVWRDFDNLIKSVFSQRFWDDRNIIDKEIGTKIYIEKDKSLYFIEFSRGSGYYYNENFPDEFELLEKKDNFITFKLIGHYSPIWPLDQESSIQRNERRKAEYDYVIEFPIKMILTDDGWRFDVFHSTLADEKESDQTFTK